MSVNRCLCNHRKENHQMTTDQIENIFTYHAPSTNQIGRYQDLRDMARELAFTINALCPESREKSIAITKLQEAIQMANASIAINEKDA